MDRQIFEAVNHEVVRRLGEGRRPADLSAEELSALITGAIEAAVAVVVPRVYGEMISRGQHLPPTPDRSLGMVSLDPSHLARLEARASGR